MLLYIVVPKIGDSSCVWEDSFIDLAANDPFSWTTKWCGWTTHISQLCLRQICFHQYRSRIHSLKVA